MMERNQEMHPINLTQQRQQSPRFFSIANQLRYGLVATVIASVLVVGGTLVYLTFQHEVQQMKELQQERSQAAATKISGYVDTLQRQLNYLSELRGFVDFDATARSSLLDGLVNSNSAYEVVGILNSDGEIIQAVSPYEPISAQSIDLTVLRNNSLILAKILRGENYVSPVEIDPKIGLPVTTLAVPIRDSQNNITGVLFAKINLNFLEQITARTPVGHTGYIYVLDDRAVLIASSNKGSIFQLQGLSSRPFIRQLVQLTQRAESQANLIYNGLQNEQVIGAAALARRVKWMVVVELPITEVYAPVWRMILVMSGAALIGTIAAAGVGVACSRSLTIPLEHLTHAATRMSDGQFDSRVNITAANELGDLARSFNQMAGQLEEAFTALETANTALENRVEQRTLELKEANEKITRLNDQLHAENIRLGTELDVARKLQHMILPNKSELEQVPGLEIACFMEPAEEVGGDYYDVLQHNGSVKIGIGDVTGHGLSSGVLMLMVQTAIRTLLASNETDPVKFLNTLNSTIYENVRRMKSDKTVTLALLDYQPGSLTLSGQHEELIIVRSTGAVERIDTFELGFPIGLEEDITPFIAEKKIPLHPGDIVVLYTDGIVEAKNANKMQYGLDRLCEILCQNAHLSADQVQAAVLNDVKNYIGEQKLRDDITLLVLKQK